MKDLYLRYPEEHLKYAKWIAYSTIRDYEPHKYRSCSDEIVWNDLNKGRQEAFLNLTKDSLFVYLQFMQLLQLKEFAVTWKCPVCDTISEDAPEDHEICSECKTHFDYEDSAYTWQERQERWNELRKNYDAKIK